MPAHNRRSSFSSSTSSSLAKRQASSASSTNNVGKVMVVPPHLAKKRAPLGNLTNLKNASHSAAKSSVPPPVLVPCATKAVKTRKTPTLIDVKTTSVVVPSNVTTLSRTDAIAVSSSMAVSPTKSDGASVSMDETMSTCDSFKSPDVEYVDNNDVPAVDSVERKTKSSLCISGHVPIKGELMDKCLKKCFFKPIVPVLYEFLSSCFGAICR
ncbi:Cyclin-A1-1 [Cucurbita argyrosperma subsp. argyrosperma]|nr:Cyclin-A1-1 [Cucurbita argyrosperma subsp. argyrosperma]